MDIESCCSLMDDEPEELLVASNEDRRYLYTMSKKGFTAKQRRDCWLLASGALNMQMSYPENYYFDLVAFSEKVCEEYPTQHFHQIKVDLPRTFADEVFFNKNSSIGKEV